MIRFECDYLEGAHPSVLSRLVETNMEQNPGYGEDPHCEHARELIRDACRCPDAQVHFLVGGTQANTTVIAALLRPWQGAISADSGHINVHETGAVEATGHKVLPLPAKDGKITARQVDEYIAAHFADATHEHMVQPGVVYISQPTETGTLYSKAELTALHEACVRHSIPLFVDGARLGYGLCSPANDVSLPELARLCDVFYIGGTKVGALFGEAIVVTNPARMPDFRYMIKRHGGMLAKGRLLGIQFEALFENGLYYEISRHAIEAAARLTKMFEAAGCGFYAQSPTNQVFPILTEDQAQRLAREFTFSRWANLPGGRVAARFCSSWATTKENLDALEAALKSL